MICRLRASEYPSQLAISPAVRKQPMQIPCSSSLQICTHGEVTDSNWRAASFTQSERRSTALLLFRDADTNQLEVEFQRLIRPDGRRIAFEAIGHFRWQEYLPGRTFAH